MSDRLPKPIESYIENGNLTPSRANVKTNASKYKVKFDIEAPRRYLLPILYLIGEGMYASQIADHLKTTRQHIQYYIRKLVDAGLLIQTKRSNIAIYELTESSKNLLRSCEGIVYPAELLRLDKCQVGFTILREGIYPKGAFKAIEMQNWTALLGLEQGVVVRHTSKQWIVHVKVLWGFTDKELYNQANDIAFRVGASLSSKYGCLLGAPQMLCGEVAVDDPVARFFGQYFVVKMHNRKIDHSWGIGELEHTTSSAVAAYMRMPEEVKIVRDNQTIMMQELVELRKAVEELKQAVCKANNEKESLASNLKP